MNMNEQNDQTVGGAIQQAFTGSAQTGTIPGGVNPPGRVMDPGNPKKWENMGQTAIEKGVPAAVRVTTAATSLAPKLSLPVRIGLFAFGVTTDQKAVSDAIVKAILKTKPDTPEADTDEEKKKKK